MALLISSLTLRAVEVNNGIQTTAPTGSDINNWGSGWGSVSISGWDYVGNLNGASCVYLGNGWVITAGHVGAGNVTINGVDCTAVAGSTHTLLNPNSSNADLIIFQITGDTQLPALTLANGVSIGATVAMIGYGDDALHTEKSWGENTVTLNNTLATDSDNGISTVVFGTDYGTSMAWGVPGDSGGAGFIYNSFTHQWQLAGIMIADDPDTKETYLAQLSFYQNQINSIMASSIPEPSVWTLMAAGFGILLIAGSLRRK